MPRRSTPFPAAIFVAVAAALVAVAPLAARDCTFSSNLVANCDFATDLSSWYFTADSAVHVPNDGATALGCAAVDRHDGVHAMEAFSDCVLVPSGFDFGAGGSIRLASGAAINCNFAVWLFTDTICGAFLADRTISPALPTSTWSAFFGFFAGDATAHSAKVRYYCSNESQDFVVRLDDFWLVPLIFHDGFESGNTNAWSVVVP